MVILSVEQGQALVDKYFGKYNELREQCTVYYSQGKQPPESLDLKETELSYMLRHIKELLEAEGFDCVFDMEQPFASSSGIVRVKQ